VRWGKNTHHSVSGVMEKDTNRNRGKRLGKGSETRRGEEEGGEEKNRKRENALPLHPKSTRGPLRKNSGIGRKQ